MGGMAKKTKGYAKGGMSKKTKGYAKGGMAKGTKGYAKGGMTKALKTALSPKAQLRNKLAKKTKKKKK